MKIHWERAAAGHLVTGYGAGWVQVDQERQTRGFILTPEQLIPWRAGTIDDIGAEDFQPVVALAPTVFLLGTGAVLKFPSAACLKLLIEAGIGYEVMDTPAACRTYNILAAEGRNVALAVMI